MTKKSANSPKVLSVNCQDPVGHLFCQENQTTPVKDRKKWEPYLDKRSKRKPRPGNTNWRGRLSTVDLLIKV